MTERVGSASRALSLVLLVAIAGCSNPGGQSGATATPTAPAGAATSASPAAGVIEDSGLETPLAPGSYVSRLFKPTLSLELGEGWFRRDAVSERTLDLRRGTNGEADVTFISGVDFLQCGADPVVTKPDARMIVDAITSSTKLTSTEPADVAVGDLSGIEVRLSGGGAPVPEADFLKTNLYGCVLTIGDTPFPAEALWVFVTQDAVLQLVAVDVAGSTVLIRGQAATGTTAHFDLVLDLLKDVSLG